MGWWASFTGEQGARDAQRKQQQGFDAALAANPLAGAKYNEMQQGIVGDMASGKNAAIDENQYNQNFNNTVKSQVNSGFGGNMWSTARQKALQVGAENLRNDMTDQANQNRAGALAALRGASDAQQNILAQKAGAIQNTKRGYMDTMSSLMNMGANAAAMYKAFGG